MDNKTSLVITVDDALTGKTQQKTFTDVNPEADNLNLFTFAQKTVAMTKDTFKEAKRVDVTDLDGIPPTPLPPRTFTDVRYGFGGNPNKALPVDGIINCLTTDWPRTISGNTGYYNFNLRFWGVEDPVVPTWEFSTNGDTAWHTNTFSCGYPTSRWSINMANVGLCTEDMDDMVPQTLTAKLTFPATANFDEWSKTFTIIITEPEG